MELEDFNELEEIATSLDFAKLGDMKPVEKPVSENPQLRDMIEFISLHEDEPPVEIALTVLKGVANDSMNEYLSDSSISSSACKEVLKSPLHYFYYSEEGYKEDIETYRKNKSHFELGTFIHLAFLEPDLFDKCIVEPYANMASHDGCNSLINFYQNQILEAAKKGEINQIPAFEECVKVDDKRVYIQKLKYLCPYISVPQTSFDIIKIIKRNYLTYGNGIIPKLLKGAIVETSFYAEDEATGLRVKVRPDALNIEENIGVNAVISVKSTSAQDIRKFFHDAAKYRYELSEGMYQKVISDVTGIEFNVTIMIMLQTCAPFLPAVFWWKNEDIEAGRYKYEHALQTIKECQESGVYPGYDALSESGNCGIIEMELPQWINNELHPVDVKN